MNVYSPREIDGILHARGLSPSKKRGQNFLIDRNIAERIADTAPRGRMAHAVEIGPGLGSLTRMLQSRYASLTAVEFDRGFHGFLTEDADLSRVHFLHSDIRTISLAEHAARMDVYGNIPYNISSSILEWLFIDNAMSWNFAVFLVQNEFAKRLAASPGTDDYSALTLLGNFSADIKRVFTVPRTVFHPRPSVESAVIALMPHGRYDMQYFDVFRMLTRALFHNRRKTFRNNLLIAPHLLLDMKIADEILAASKLSHDIRGECIDCDTVYAIACRFAEILRTANARTLQGNTKTTPGY
ncbi:MAG: 16S rRNA (adenine(1518)-N(6)/adenine(1519)-N(6))-dimethyltransferase RsmA [Spirochaetota bacterium]